MSIPLFSIITPCLNRAEFIFEAVESVLAQNYKDFEHIIIDGGSTDGTLELLERYPHLKIQSDQDQGMYDAINKGLKLAKGEIIGFLNSDDLYAEDVFAIVAEKFKKQDTLAVAGEALIFSVSSDGVTNIVSNYSPQADNLLRISTIGDPYFNAWFFRRSIFKQTDKFDTSYRIIADREFMLRLALSGLHYETISKLIYRYRKHPDSMTFDITDHKLQSIIDEHIFMTGTYLEKRNLPLEARNLIRQLRTRDTSDMAVCSLRKFDFDKFIYYLQRGIKYDPLWLLSFTRRALHINYG